MLSITNMLRMASRGLAIYIAAALQLVLFPQEGPQLLLAVAGWILCSTTPKNGIVWTALIGLGIDLAGHDRLGLHLATCGVLGSLAISTGLTATDSEWRRVLIAGWLALGDPLISQVLCGLLQQRPLDFEALLSEAGRTSLWTAGTVAAVLLLREITIRSCQPLLPSGRLELQNQWTGLAEH